MHVGLRFNSLLTKYFAYFFCHLLILFIKINFFEKFFQEHSIRVLNSLNSLDTGGSGWGVWFSLFTKNLANYPCH